MSGKSKTGIRPGMAPPEVSVAHYVLNAVAPTGQLLREATTHGCPKKPLGFSPRRSVTIFDQFLAVHYANPAAREICAELLGKRTAENPPEQFLRNFLSGQNKTWQSGFRKTVLSPSLRLFNVHVFPVFHDELTIKNKELYVASLIPESLAPDHNFLEINTGKYNLTPRELEVLDLVLKGYRNQDIADALFVSLHTVKTHLQNIFKKMGVTNRTGLFYKMSRLSQRY